jgi:hypothetical protein
MSAKTDKLEAEIKEVEMAISNLQEKLTHKTK